MTVTLFWSPKGGSGTTVAACCFAMQQPHDRSVLVVDAASAPDVAAVFGLPSREPSTKPCDVSGNVDLLVNTSWESTEQLSKVLDAYDDVIIDAGTNPEQWVSRSDSTIVVLRACYLSLRRYMARDIDSRISDRAVLIEEPGRALTPRDVSQVIDLPVTTIAFDPAISRTVDGRKPDNSNTTS